MTPPFNASSMKASAMGLRWIGMFLQLGSFGRTAPSLNSMSMGGHLILEVSSSVSLKISLYSLITSTTSLPHSGGGHGLFSSWCSSSWCLPLSSSVVVLLALWLMYGQPSGRYSRVMRSFQEMRQGSVKSGETIALIILVRPLSTLLTNMVAMPSVAIALPVASVRVIW